MNAKKAKQLRKFLRGKTQIDWRQAEYIERTAPNQQKNIRLAPDCGKGLYKTGKFYARNIGALG